MTAMQMPTKETRDISSNDHSKKILEILSYWHKLEFFIPFDLDQRVDDTEDWQVLWLDKQALSEESAIPSTRWQDTIPEKYSISGFNLYLGIFDKSEIAQVCEQRIQAKSDCMQEYEDAERTELEGRTCFAKLKLNAQGEPLFEQVSISTAPWALGQIQKDEGLAALRHHAFQQAKQRLAEGLHNFRTKRRVLKEHEESVTTPLTGIEILALHELFCEWADYWPASAHPIAALEVCVHKNKALKVDDLASKDIPSTTPKLTETQQDENESEEAPEPDIDILNSFFIQDIERVMASVEAGLIPVPLEQYLTPLSADARIDLYSEAGHQSIFERLHPKYLNLGHWFDDAKKGMNLMQQFAVNSALASMTKTGLFSVNGPPGTGKTTLLRDLFADNIVRRAQVLASFEQATDAFDGKIQVQLNEESSSTWIAKLKPELIGFEMVVASSNNAAIENISRDLPKRGQFGSAWQTQRYLQPIAHKIAAQKEDGSFSKLSEHNMPWGLISCTLGNAKNRWAFKNRFAFMKVEQDEKPTWAGLDKPQTIWEWIDHYKGLSFCDAVTAFKEAEEKTRSKITERLHYANLLAEIIDSPEELFLAPETEALNAAIDFYQRTKASDDQTREQLLALTDSLTHLKEDERLIKRIRPSWLKKTFFLFSKSVRQYTQQAQNNAQAQLALRKQIAELTQRYYFTVQPELIRASNTYEKVKEALRQKKIAWSRKNHELNQLAEKFSHLTLPKSLADLELESFQKNGLWHDEALAHSRSALFGAALTLHEAWLAEVAKRGAGFRGNLFAITRLLANKHPQKEEHILPIWQSFFMVVPVVSTTFASFSNQFKGLGPGSLGWLFIDEAGQAVPQAAVGALWRAQRAMVVGDPLQIEPVFTLPSKLVTALSQLSSHTDLNAYAPNKVSVQRLADHANRFGTAIKMEGSEPLWVGSPLRVHWRCIDPMFCLSNQIAYQNKMILGSEKRMSPDNLPIHYKSAWIDITGQVNKKQDVRQQIEFIVELLTQICLCNTELPSLYIISPFKAIKNELKKALSATNQNKQRVKKSDLTKWCKAHIGTVHTFQGKEADTVIMVLGADHEHMGAAQWASSKPNILNVALTRARYRFYMVGDKALWGKMPYFKEAIQKFPASTAEQFLQEAFVSTLTMPT